MIEEKPAGRVENFPSGCREQSNRALPAGKAAARERFTGASQDGQNRAESVPILPKGPRRVYTTLSLRAGARDSHARGAVVPRGRCCASSFGGAIGATTNFDGAECSHAAVRPVRRESCFAGSWRGIGYQSFGWPWRLMTRCGWKMTVKGRTE